MLKTVSSITNAIGALNYKGTWNASTNTPTIVSGTGTKGDYYVVSVAGTTTIDGISNWGVGDWIAFNGAAWQRVEGGADLNGVNVTFTGTASGPTGVFSTDVGIGPAGVAPGYAFQASNIGGELAALFNNRDSSGGANFRLLKSRGTYALPVVANSGDDISAVSSRVYARNSGDTADAYIEGTRISSYVTGVDAQNRVNVALGFWTADAASGTVQRRFIVDHQGYMRFAAVGLGIQFNNDTAAANALDDYEEGTFTPTYVAATNFTSVTYDVQTGQYTKIGNVVFINISLRTDALSGGSGAVRIEGLPFSPVTIATATVGETFAFGTPPTRAGFVSTNSSVFLLKQTTFNGDTSALDAADMGTTTNDNLLRVSGFYLIT